MVMLQTKNTNVRFLNVKSGNGADARIAYETFSAPGSTEPGIVWFPGFRSSMSGTKATALKEWAEQHNKSFVCFEYSGHGSSSGDYTDGTISQWLQESLAILREIPVGPQIVVGSSMGAWIILLILRSIARDDSTVKDLPSIAGAVLIAPAYDMTEELMWKQFTSEVRREIETVGVYQRPSRYGDGPYMITRELIEDGRKHLIGADAFRPPCPVRIVHGIEDPDVPWRHVNRLNHILTGENVMLSFIQDGDHRLSRPDDIEKTLFVIDDLYETLGRNAHYI